MKMIVCAVLALIVGYALGGWPLRTEQLRLQDQVESLEAKLADAGPRRSSLGGIGRMLNVPAKSSLDANDDFANLPDPTLDPEPAPTEDTEDPAPPPKEERQEPGTDDFESRIEKAVELWRVRSDLARGALLNQVDASEDETLRFDVVMEAMNVRLEASIQKWADVFAAEAVPQQEAAIRMMNEITEALAITYDELDRNLAEGWKTDVRETFELTDFIDPSVALPLAGVQDKLDFE